MNKLKIFCICLLISILASLLLITATGCKTRHVSSSQTDTRTEFKQDQSSQTSSETKEQVSDKGHEQVSTKDSSSSESETTMEMEIDSIKTDRMGNTTVYTKPGSKTKFNNKSKFKQSGETNASKQNNLDKSSSSKQDSSGSNHLGMEQQIEDDNKETDAQGSGSQWPWMAGGVLVIVGLFFVFLNRRKSK